MGFSRSDRDFDQPPLLPTQSAQEGINDRPTQGGIHGHADSIRLQGCKGMFGTRHRTEFRILGDVLTKAFREILLHPDRLPRGIGRGECQLAGEDRGEDFPNGFSDLPVDLVKGNRTTSPEKGGHQEAGNQRRIRDSRVVQIGHQ